LYFRLCVGTGSTDYYINECATLTSPGIESLIKEKCKPSTFLTFNHFYWPTNALNCIKLNRLKSRCINILRDN